MHRYTTISLLICGLLLGFAATAAGQSTPAQAKPAPSSDEDTPVLIKHLPNWESVSRQATYVVTLDDLKRTVPNQPVLDAVSFEGGTEAVTATYGQSQMAIVEFSTPQFSVDNDQRIAAKIADLKAQSQPAPTAYRRVGNYSVFVFNATDEASANQLIDQVQYQKTVQWLGEDPHLYQKLQRYFAETSAGVLVAVLKSSGLSLIACLAIGGLFGFLLFRQRRAQSAAAYSDAGGQVRLNLDELTDTQSHARLLPPPQKHTD
jgi:hypothetical protein